MPPNAPYILGAQSRRMDFFAPLLRLRLLGGDVDPVTPAEMLAATEVFLAGGGTAVIANHDSQSLRLMRRTPAVRAFFEKRAPVFGG